MSGLRFTPSGSDASVLLTPDGATLMRYVFAPTTSADEAPRPFAHPVRTLAGEELTNFRPNDHPWHHALSFTIGRLGEWNFWGGPSYRRADGYRARGDQGRQRHVAWLPAAEGELAHEIEWLAGDAVLLREQRRLTARLESSQAWSLRWQSEFTNVSGRALACGNYHSAEGLVGSHYTGLQFRGARDLLDDHGDATLGVFGPDGRAGEAAVHGVAAPWMEWRGQKDTSLRRVTVRFENIGAPLAWFVRRNNPLAAFAFQFDRDLPLLPGAGFRVEHRLVFTDA